MNTAIKELVPLTLSWLHDAIPGDIANYERYFQIPAAPSPRPPTPESPAPRDTLVWSTKWQVLSSCF